MQYDYKKKKTLQQRIQESNKIKCKYSDRIPVICEISKSSNLKLDKCKYLVPHDVILGQFIQIIRKRINIMSEIGIFFTVGDNIFPGCGETINSLYKQYKDEDGFLYMCITAESTFGNC